MASVATSDLTSSPTAPAGGRRARLFRLSRKLAWCEVKLFVREPLTLVFAIGFPLVMLFVLAEVFGTTPSTEPLDNGVLPWRGVAPLSYYVPGYVALVAAAAGLIMIPAHLAGYRERGVLRRLHASSIPGAAIMTSQVVVQVVLSALGGALVVAAAYSVYDLAAPISYAGIAVAFVFTVAAFAGIGVLLGAVMPSPRAAQGAGVMLFFVMMMLSGTGPPLEVMTPLMRDISAALPLQHAMHALQDPWLGFGWNWTQLGVLAGIGVAGMAAAALILRRR
jgi:ABC-2 type transport system permease protein